MADSVFGLIVFVANTSWNVLEAQPLVASLFVLCVLLVPPVMKCSPSSPEMIHVLRYLEHDGRNVRPRLARDLFLALAGSSGVYASYFVTTPGSLRALGVIAILTVTAVGIAGLRELREVWFGLSIDPKPSFIAATELQLGGLVAILIAASVATALVSTR